MISIIKAKNRHFNDFGWLKTYWLFSFSDYYDKNNIQFGSLRVFNDDVVEPSTGFPTHPHEEMEIITIVLDGEMTHRDSMGNKAIIKAGDVQRMSAGTGITHSEYNLSYKPVHFYQIWIFPNKSKTLPSYDQKSFNPLQWKNRILPVASGQNLPDTVSFQADATIFMADIDPEMKLKFGNAKDRCTFIYLTKGRLTLNDLRMDEKDQARIENGEQIDILAHESSELILIDVPACRNKENGRNMVILKTE